jgi:hypothetical protein
MYKNDEMKDKFKNFTVKKFKKYNNSGNKKKI